MTMAVHINQTKAAQGTGGNGFGISLNKYVVRIRFYRHGGRVFDYEVPSCICDYNLNYRLDEKAFRCTNE